MLEPPQRPSAGAIGNHAIPRGASQEASLPKGAIFKKINDVGLAHNKFIGPCTDTTSHKLE